MIEGDIHFITGIGRTVARDDCCARVSIKSSVMILGWILSMLFTDFNARGLRSIPMSPMVALMEFFHADAVINDHSLLGLWYLNSCSLWQYLYSCAYIMTILCSTADAVSSGG